MIYNYKYNYSFHLIQFPKSSLFTSKTRYGDDDSDSGVLGQFPPRHMVLPDK
jgi:hypothetical protein